MKRLKILAITLLGLSLSVAADSGQSYTAKTVGKANFNKKKFYINPGHGGHDSDDRPIALPCGVAMFYESDGNLDRAVHLKDFLVNNNANVRLSRTTNKTSDDLGLSTIASQSNSYGGYFISLHSNGANASSNYVVSYYRTSSTNKTKETITGSKDFAYQAAKWHDDCTLSDQTYSTPRALGDYSFYGYNLGVLRTNNCVGYLLETWFHDYRPEALRMKSTVYNKFLAWQIARAAMANPGATGDLGCVVQGDIRDKSKTCGYTNYTTRNRDKFKAVEGATVKLLDASGTVLQEMTTDNCENGYYAFFDLKAKTTYKVSVSKSGYQTTTKEFTTGTNSQNLLTFDLEEGANNGITIDPSDLNFGSIPSETSSSKIITVTATGVTGNLTVTCDNSNFTLSSKSLSSTGGSLTISFNPKKAGSYTGTVTIKGGSYTRTLVVSGLAYNAPLLFTEVWNYSETSGKNESWTSDKSLLRNMTYGDGKLYVVKPSVPEILIINAETGKQEGTVCLDGVDGGTFKIMDVQYVDGKLLATNLAAKTGDPLKVYLWNNGVNVAPQVILNTTDFSGFTRIGDTFSYKGTLSEGTICYSAGTHQEQNKIVQYAVSNKEANTTPTAIGMSEDGTDNIIVGTSPRVIPDGDNFWVTGQNYYPTLVSAEGLLQYTVKGEALNNELAGNTFTKFSFKGSDYAFATTYTPNSDSKERLRDGRAVLLDGSNGWSEAKNIGEYPSNGLGNTRNTTFSGNIAVNVIEDECVEMWVLVNNQGIAHYRYGSKSSDNEGTETPGVTGSTEIGTVETVWEYSQQKGNLSKASSWLSYSASPYSRSIAVIGDNLYVLTSHAFNNSPVINIIDANTGEYKGELMSGSTDLTTTSNYNHAASLGVIGNDLYLSNSVNSDTHVLRVYKFTNGKGTPEKVLEINPTPVNALGDVIACANNRIAYCDGSNIVYFTVSNGTVNKTPNKIAISSTLGGTTTAGRFSAYPMTDGTFWVTGTASYPTHIGTDGKIIETIPSTALTSNRGTSVSVFNFGTENKMYLSTISTFDNNKWDNGKFEVVDLSNGVAKATLKCSVPEASLGTGNWGTAEGVVSQFVQVSGKANSVFKAWALVPTQGIAHFKFNGEKETTTAIKDVVVEEEECEIEYYNLQGVRVSTDNITPGIYIKRQGTKTSKILVR